MRRSAVSVLVIVVAVAAAVSVAAAAAPKHGAPSAAPQSRSALEKRCSTAEKHRRVRALRAFQRRMRVQRRLYFRTHRNATARTRFVKRQQAKLRALKRAVTACNTKPKKRPRPNPPPAPQPQPNPQPQPQPQPPPPPQPSPQTTLEVRTFRFDDAASGNRGDPAGAGTWIRVNGQNVGRTGADGGLVAQIAPGTAEVSAVIPSFAEGSETVEARAGQTTVAEIVLDDNGEVVEPAQLALAELRHGVLAADFTGLTLAFSKDGASVPLTEVQEVLLHRPSGFDEVERSTPVDDAFTVDTGGRVVATDVEAVRAALIEPGGYALEVLARDGDGFSYSGSVRFHVGRHALRVRLTAPPSAPSLAVAGQSVRVRLLNAAVSYDVVTDAQGRFELAGVPGGTVGIAAETLQSGRHYYGEAQVGLEGDLQVDVSMRNVDDVLAGVPPFEVESEPEAELLAPRPAFDRLAGAGGIDEAAPLAADETEPFASITVSAAGEGVPMQATANGTVPKGTEEVVLKYEVCSAEYPEWVRKQSQYDDTWNLAVLGGSAGGQLVSASQHVNAQLHAPPTWQANGCTGELQQKLDVKALTTNADATLTLAAMATNIGDALLATSVSATLEAEEMLTIDALRAGAVPGGTDGDGSFYSIPRSGDRNVFNRTFDVDYTAPKKSEVSNLKVVLRGGGADLMTIVDEGIGDIVEQLDKDTLRVRVTLDPKASTVDSTPPPTHAIEYRFTLEVKKAEGGEKLTSEPKDSTGTRALWRMPNGFPRYGGEPRDPGLDDWCSDAAYDWLETNRALITRIDDISGEHAKDIGHSEHETGTDIDMFHVYTFPNGAASGGTNYTRLTENVIAAMRGGPGGLAAQARVNDWAMQTRARFDQLLPMASVRRIYYAIGDAAAEQNPPPGSAPISLAAGWARRLLRNGAVTAQTGQQLQLAAGAWANANNAKMGYNSTHNSHIHLDLNP